ncbi:MAG TPA: hypothetical protein PKA05_06515, partial [Roseiflexaceae bacterium]|nr:hypothetical protein [Roseiflexaceae bacterium]
MNRFPHLLLLAMLLVLAACGAATPAVAPLPAIAPQPVEQPAAPLPVAGTTDSVVAPELPAPYPTASPAGRTDNLHAAEPLAPIAHPTM